METINVTYIWIDLYYIIEDTIIYYDFQLKLN